MKRFKYSDVVTDQDYILLLGPGIPNHYGGMYNYVLMWLDEIKYYTKKHLLLVKTNDPIKNDFNILRKDIWSDKNQKNIKLSALAGIILPIQIVSIFFKKDLKKLISSFSIIHILTASFLTNTLIKILFHYDNNIKVIYTLHDPQSHDENISFFGRILKEYNLKAIYRLSSKNKRLYLHLHSESLLKDCPIISGNVIIHPHPLPKRLIKKKPLKPNNKIRFGFLGRIEPYKGLDIMFEAFKLIEHDISSFSEIVIVGRGDFNTEKWKNELSYDLTIVNQMVSDEFFHQQMCLLDCLILPYKRASQSGVGYMALAYNIPIIATKTGGLPDIIKISKQKNSTLVPANDSIKLGEAIKKFFESLKS